MVKILLHDRACRSTRCRPNVCYLGCGKLEYCPLKKDYICRIGAMGPASELRGNKTEKWVQKAIDKEQQKKAVGNGG